jgi:hypothetical protein
MDDLTIILLVLAIIGTALFLYVLLDKESLQPKQQAH